MSDKPLSLLSLTATDTGTDIYAVHNGNSRRTPVRRVVDLALSTSALTDTGSHFTSSSVEGALRELAHDENYFNVKNPAFGAKGDGSTNDSTAIQAAITACAAAGGGTVWFPPGTYIASGLSWPDKVVLRGAGQGRDLGAIISRLKLPNSSAALAYIIASSTYISNSASTNLGQAGFDLCFDGNKANQSNDAAANVVVRCFAARFFNCYFTKSSGHGVLATCESANGTDGGSVVNTEFLSCDFTDCDFAGLYCDNDGANTLADVFVRGCTFAFNGAVDDANKWRSLMIERGAGCHIQNNQMYGCPNGNILMSLAGLAIISNNHFDAGATGDNDANVEIALGGYAQLSFTGNMLWDDDASAGAPKTHLKLTKGGVTFLAVSIVGNSFSYGQITGSNAQHVTATSFSAGDKVYLIGNAFYPNTTRPSGTPFVYGADLDDSDNTHVMRQALTSNLSADRTLSWAPGDSDRTITLSGNPTLADWFDQAVKQASSPTFAAITLSNGQIVFPASQNASAGANTLDDYEEGTFTPVFTFATPGNLAITYSIQTGEYTKIGRLVVADTAITSSAFTHTSASGNATVTGFPFNFSGTSRGQLMWQGITKANYTQAALAGTGGATTATIQMSGSGQALATLTTADIPTGGTLSLRSVYVYDTA